MTVEVIRWTASLMSILAAILVAANISVKISGFGFIAFTFASMCWIVAGMVSNEPALILQNVVLTLVNILGIYRYLIRPAVFGKTANSI